MSVNYVEENNPEKGQELLKEISPLGEELKSYVDIADIVLLVNDEVKTIYEVKSLPNYMKPKKGGILAVMYQRGLSAQLQPDKEYLSIMKSLQYNASRKQQPLALHIHI